MEKKFRGGFKIPQRRRQSQTGTSIHYVANFHRKLHENEERWTERVGCPKFDYVDPPLTLILT